MENHVTKKTVYTDTAKVRYSYVPVQELLENEDEEKYITYGISVRTSGSEVGFISDVSTELDAVQRLAALCTEKELAPEHLNDVVEDFLADESLIAN